MTAPVRHVLGLDIGSNSVGSAWADLELGKIDLGVSVFPAGVDEQDDKRGAPKNVARRQARSQRRGIRRRSDRKRKLQQLLIETGLLPLDEQARQSLFDLDPWELRRKGLSEPLSAFEFGRILVHLAQRRGALGVTTDPENEEEGKVKEGIDRLNKIMRERGARTVGELVAILRQASRETTTGRITQAVATQVSRRTRQRRRQLGERSGAVVLDPVRNRQYRIAEDQQLYADRRWIRDEFQTLFGKQRALAGELAPLLTDGLLKQLDDPVKDSTWRHRGQLFGQRNIYWDTGTLGRCDLEPTERCAPIADMHASYFRVVETVNNIRVETRGKSPEPLTEKQRAQVISLLRGPLFKKVKGKLEPKSSASITDIKTALEINPRDPNVLINLQADEERDINCDWFHREIVHGVFTEAGWSALDSNADECRRKQEGVNRALLRFDPDEPEDELRLREGSGKWWKLDSDAIERLIAAWKRRPKLENRLNLSRRAISNLIPFMEKFDKANNRWPTQQEARKAYARTLTQQKDEHGRRRYETGAPGLTARDRYFMRQKKHEIAPGVPALPPAPMLSNPVVRKTIHEVRRHITAYLRKFGCRPDRVVIEMARITKQSESMRNAALARNRAQEKIRKSIIDEVLPAAFGPERAARLTLNQQRSAVDRVLLARQQTQVCPYCGKAGFTDGIAAQGAEIEIDHILPYSRTGNDGIANKVLCHKSCNQGKCNQILKAWWGSDFEERLRPAEQLFKNPAVTYPYFSPRDYQRKWANFTREIREEDEWRNSQLTDTAYAARQVAAYLADALFDGRGLPERGDGTGQQRVFFTVGRITSILRRDWQLYQSLKPEDAGKEHSHNLSAAEERALAEKNRGDHREHAIDAAVIALTDPYIKTQLANWAAEAAEYRDRNGHRPRRRPIAPPPPWTGSVPQLRSLILQQLYERFDSSAQSAGRGDECGRESAQVVSHRPVKRRLVGAFHEETHYGPVVGPQPAHRTESLSTLFTNRISAERLTPNHLRVPPGWDERSARLEEASSSNGHMSSLRRELAELRDPSPGKSGIVRDRALRDRIRKCLRSKGVDPDDFSPAQIKKLIADGHLAMRSGVPIKGVVLLRTNTEPVIVPRKRWDHAGKKWLTDDDPRTARVYIGGNNHHIEIRQDRRTGKWSGEVVPTFEVAKRVRIRKLEAVDRADADMHEFVMSLAEGEMIHARRKDRAIDAPGAVGYFVVAKLDKPARIHFAPHWDARRAGEQDRWSVSPADLKDCGVIPGEPPAKVRVNPLGEVRRLVRD